MNLRNFQKKIILMVFLKPSPLPRGFAVAVESVRVASWWKRPVAHHPILHEPLSIYDIKSYRLTLLE